MNDLNKNNELELKTLELIKLNELLREANEKLAHSEERYRTLFEKSAYPIAIIKDYRHVDCNQAGLDILKIKSKGDFVKLNPWDITPKFQPDGSSSKQKLQKMIKIALTKGFHEFEWVFKDTNGKHILFNISFNKILTRNEDLLYVVFRDVSKQKEIENALIESESRFRELFVHSPIAYQSLDENGNYIDLNLELAKLLEYKPEEILGKNFENFWVKNQQPSFSKRFKFAQEMGNITTEIQLLTKTGKILTVLLEGKIQFDAQGNFDHSHCMLHNITDRKLQEKKLKSISKKLAKAQAIASVGHFEWYPDTNKIKGSDEYYRIYKSTRETHNCFNHFINKVHPDDRQNVHEALDYAIKNKENYDAKYRLKLKRGITKHIHAVGEFRFDSEGNPEYLMGIVHDITKQVESEKKIKDSENRLKHIFNTVQVGIIISIDRKITFANQYMYNLFGYKPEEILLKDSLFAYSSKEEYELAGQKIKSGLESVGVYVYETQLQNKKGEIIDSLIKGAYYNGENDSDGIISVITDITEQKKIEAELKKVNDEKDKYFSIIAHDLKGPFNAMLGMTNLLIEDFVDFTEDEKLESIISVNNSVKKTYELLENLLTWAQSQSGRIEYNPEIISVSNFVLETIRLLQSVINKKEITINHTVNEDLYVIADKQTMDTVLRNLLSNAIKFTKRKGAISISSSLIKMEDQNNKIEICVKDNGVGIPKDTMNKLFKIEEHISTIGTENEYGTGLGLILCKEFTENNGGKIWAESENGKGTTFRFTLPEHKLER